MKLKNFKLLSSKLLLVVLILFSNLLFSQVSNHAFSSTTGSYLEITGGTVLGNTSTDEQRFVDTVVPLGGTSEVRLSSSSTSSNIKNRNNVIYNVRGYGYSGNIADNRHGIRITAGGDYNIYYNSVNLLTNQTTAGQPSAILISSGVALDIRNNVFVNLQTTGTRYSIDFSVANTVFNNINYNHYFSEQHLGYLTSNRTTLSDLQSTIGQDANSFASNPNFVGNDELRPTAGSDVLGAINPISFVTTDILGANRSATASSKCVYENPFVLTTSPNCPNLFVPANAATGVSTTPTLQWTDGGGGTTGYKLYFGTNNPPSNIHNGTDLGNVTSYQFTTALNFATIYYWQIVAYNAYGDATGCEIRSFTTVSDPSIIPQIVNFDNVFSPALPIGWTIENTNNDGNTWNLINDNPRSIPNAIRYNYNFTNPANDWFFSPGLNLEGGKTYEVIFWYRAYVPGYPERLQVMWGSAANSTSMSNGLIWDNDDITNTTYHKASGTFTPTTSGTYYIGWHCYSAANMWNLYVDDIEIRVQPSASHSHTIPASNTSPFAFSGTGAIVQFTTANTVAITLLCERINSSPGIGLGLPTGIINLAPVYWNFELSTGTADGQYSLTLDITGIPGVNNASLLRLLRRANPNSPWTNLGTPSTVSGNLVTWEGLSGFSEFALGGDSNNPLPVELTSFTATTRDRDVQLDWQTSTEVKSSKFVIERKSDKNDNWVNVGEVQAAGNSNSSRDYRFTDKKLNSGNYSYRLRMVDIDGTFSYSDIVETTVELPKEYAISQNYPNPFNPSTRIDYQLPFDSKVMIELYSITGERVAMLSDKIEEAGYYTIEVKGSSLGLSSGVYIYRIVAQNLSDGQQYMNVKKMMMVK